MVSISSCQRCGVLACRHLHNLAAFCLVWGASLRRQVHAMVVTMVRHPPV